MSKKPVLSLCIPTNGITKWVLPVVNSIYHGIDEYSKFEVIITDNGNNTDFENVMKGLSKKYLNLRYYKTNAHMFMNQIEAFKLAEGQFIKFVNHRIALLPGTVDYLILFAERNLESKPVTYFSNGVLKLPQKVYECNSFDGYVRLLSFWSSCSAGTAMWKSDFESLNFDEKFNRMFPHTNLIFSNKNANKYIIDNKPIMKEIKTDMTLKGEYDLFGAFAVEYPRIIEDLYLNNYISKSTYDCVIRENGKFLNKLYFDYVIRGVPCSYDLSGLEKTIGIYYSKQEICGERLNNYIRHYFNLMKNYIYNILNHYV